MMACTTSVRPSAAMTSSSFISVSSSSIACGRWWCWNERLLSISYDSRISAPIFVWVLSFDDHILIEFGDDQFCDDSYRCIDAADVLIDGKLLSILSSGKSISKSSSPELTGDASAVSISSCIYNVHLKWSNIFTPAIHALYWKWAHFYAVTAHGHSLLAVYWWINQAFHVVDRQQHDLRCCNVNDVNNYSIICYP